MPTIHESTDIDELFQRALANYDEENKKLILGYADQVMTDPYKYVVVAIHNIQTLSRHVMRLDEVVRQLTLVAATNLLGEMDAEFDTRSAGNRPD